jgi:hypothetical protein
MTRKLRTRPGADNTAIPISKNAAIQVGEVSPSLQPLCVFRYPLCGGVPPQRPPVTAVAWTPRSHPGGELVPFRQRRLNSTGLGFKIGIAADNRRAFPERRFWVSLVMLCFVPLCVFPHDFTLMGKVSNFASDKTAENPPPDINDETISFAGDAEMSGDFSTNISYRLNLGLDTVWRYYLAGEAVFRYNALKFGFGTFFQYSEYGKEFLNPGMIVSLGFELPGAFFADIRTILTFYEDLEKKGNFGYDYLAFSVGYWTQNLIAGIYYDFKELKEKRTDTLLVQDSLGRIFFHTGIYDKNRMFTVNLDFGYEMLGLKMTGTKENIDQIQALFASIEFVFQMSNSVAWHIKGEIPWSFTYPLDDFWWTALTGFTIKLAD